MTKYKYRHKVIKQKIIKELNTIFQELLEKWDCQLIEFNGEKDQVHLLISTHPNLSLSKLVNNLKTVSSRNIRKNHKEYLSKFYWKPFFWHRAYCIVSAGGATIRNHKKIHTEPR